MIIWRRFFERHGDGFQILYHRKIDQSIISQIEAERPLLAKLSKEMERKKPRGVVLQQKEFTKAAGLTPGYGGCSRIGRFEVVGATDIRRIDREVWNALHSDGYTSFDISSCNPTIVSHLFDAPLLRLWVDDQASCIPSGASRADMKKAVNAILNV